MLLYISIYKYFISINTYYQKKLIQILGSTITKSQYIYIYFIYLLYKYYINIYHYKKREGQKYED